MIWQFVGDVGSYFPFVINRRNGVQSYGGASIPFAIRSSVINQKQNETLNARNFSRLAGSTLIRTFR